MQYIFMYICVNISGRINKLKVFIAYGEGNWMAGHKEGKADSLYDTSYILLKSVYVI